VIVIGTAGHIDHGKSSIVRRLTGTDPDRLPEEQARGMTIDLGFAFYRTAHNDDLAFVDVPGHERFVKNMIAGAGGIDAVMMVVAADDGWMPQSEAHFQICRLLGVRHGFIVINKVDLAEPDWVELLEHEIRQKVAASFLAESPVIRVSAETGAGFDTIVEHLETLPERIAARRDLGKARLYIDRSFVRPGMGGVVTGTLRGGSLKVGQPVGIWPSGEKARIRSLQTHNEDVAEVQPGHRTAVSFTGVERESLIRGGVISDRTDLTFFRDHPVLALALEMLAHAAVSLNDRRQGLIIVGTTEADGELRLFGRDSLSPGESGVVFFRPENPSYALVGDHFILRLPTPMITLGGGRVLDHLPRFPRRRDFAELAYLDERMSCTAEALVLTELLKAVMVRRDSLLREADVSETEVMSTTDSLRERQLAAEHGGYVYHRERVSRLGEALKGKLTRYFSENPHLKGLPAEALTRLITVPPDAWPPLLELLTSQGVLERKADLYDLAGRGMSLKGVILQAYNEIIATLKAEPYAPPPLAQLAAKGKVHQQAIKYLLDSGEGYKCGSEFVFLSEVWKEITGFIRERLAASDRLAVTELRDRFGFTRKFAIPILEECDRVGLTAREGDFRVKGDKFG